MIQQLLKLLNKFFHRHPPTPERPPYALLLQQQAEGTAISAIASTVPAADAKRMLIEAYQVIEQQELAALQQKGSQP